MADLKITDLIAEGEIEKLKSLSGELKTVKEIYIEVATKLAAGLKVKIETEGDLAKYLNSIGENAKQAEANTLRFNTVLQQEQQTLNNTTNTISRNLAEREKENRTKREGYEFDKVALELALKVLGTREENIARLTKEQTNLKMVKQEQSDLNKRLKDGAIDLNTYNTRMTKLNNEESKSKIAIQELNRTINNQTKEMQAAEGTYTQLSQRLEILKRAYRQLSEEEKNSPLGKQLNAAILDLDAHLKDLDADMGQFQRNVGNYAIATDKMAGSFLNLLGLPPQLSNSLKGCFETMAKGESVMASLGTKLGALGRTLMTFLANPAMLAILGIGGAVAAFKWWYDYNKGIAEATRLTKEFFGIKDSGELTALRDEIKAVADVYEKDYIDVLKTVDALHAQWGMSAQEALQVVKDGFASGADLGGNMLSLLQQYAPSFHDIGLSASETVAIIQQTRSGIFTEGGLQAIQMAGVRIRQMSESAKKSLDAIGLSSKQIEQELSSGETSIMEVIKMISSRIKELPPDCEEVGNVLKDVFGRNGAAQGLQMIESFDQMNTSLEEAKKTTGEYGELLEKQVEAQTELNKAVSELFDATDEGFENTILSLKIIGTELLTEVVKGVKDIFDWFKEWYDESWLVRGVIEFIVASVRTLWNVIEVGGAIVIDVFKTMGAAAKALGNVIQSIFEWDSEKFNKAVREWNASFNRYGSDLINNFKKNGKDVGEAWVDGYNKTVKNGDLEEPKINMMGDPKYQVKLLGEQNYDESSKKSANDASKDLSKGFEAAIKPRNKISGNGGNEDAEKDAEKAAKLAEKKRKEQEKMEEAAEKARIAAEKTNIANRLALVEKGSEEELKVKQEKLSMERDLELKEAEKNGADMALIHEKFQKEMDELDQEYAHLAVERISDRYAAESVALNESFALRQKLLAEQYAKQDISEAEYQEKKAALEEEYAKATHERAIQQVQEQIAVAGISADERQKLEEKLAKSLADLYKWEAEQFAKSRNEEVKADEDAHKKRMRNVQMYLQKTAQMLNAVTDLFGALSDAKISRIEEEEKALDEQYDKDVERIVMMEESGAITKEEAEARKRAAEEVSERKHEELERKKAQLEYKQAVLEKANKIAQIGINTAMGITSALAMFPPNIPLSITVGAIGAIQLATALAQPIKAYAKGTPEGGHDGGLALVGDGGKNEIVTYNGKAWKTSDKPQLVDLPKGAEVFPDVRNFELKQLQFMGELTQGGGTEVKVINDYKMLEREQKQTNSLLKQQMRQNARIAYLQRFYDNLKRL
jgi:hypothetical protein